MIALSHTFIYDRLGGEKYTGRTFWGVFVFFTGFWVESKAEYLSNMYWLGRY